MAHLGPADRQRGAWRSENRYALPTSPPPDDGYLNSEGAALHSSRSIHIVCIKAAAEDGVSLTQWAVTALISVEKAEGGWQAKIKGLLPQGERVGGIYASESDAIEAVLKEMVKRRSLEQTALKAGSMTREHGSILAMNSLEVLRFEPDLDELFWSKDNCVFPIGTADRHGATRLFQAVKFAFETIFTQQLFSLIPFPQSLGNKLPVRAGNSADRPAAAWVWIPFKRQQICIQQSGDSHVA